MDYFCIFLIENNHPIFPFPEIFQKAGFLVLKPQLVVLFQIYLVSNQKFILLGELPSDCLASKHFLHFPPQSRKVSAV